MKLQYIVETVSSAFDRHGNRSHFARVTSTQTGRDMVFETWGAGNAKRMVLAVTGDYAAIYGTEATISIRDWNQARKSVDLLESQVTPEMIKALSSRKP